MIWQWLRRIAGDAPAAGPSVEPVDYQGYRIQPTPRKESSGWRVMGTIVREVEGEEKVHEFIRADVYAGHDDAVSITILKAKRLIDEQGERMFRPRG